MARAPDPSFPRVVACGWFSCWQEVSDDDFEHVAPTVVAHPNDPDPSAQNAAAVAGEPEGKPLEHVEVASEPEGLVKLDSGTFDAYLKGKEYVIVDFMAPWCIWSKRLMPVWAQLAERTEKNFGRRVGVAEVDCTREEAQELCRQHHITGFPTVVGFARGETHSHDYYNGDRTVEAFSEFIAIKLAQLKEADEIEAQDAREARTRRLERVRNRGKPPPAEGCQLWGTVRVRKVPGNLVVAATSPTHSFDMSRVNVSHTVHHLSFGQEFNAVEMSVMPPELSASMTSLDGTIFNSTGQNMTHEHYLKVVNTRFEYLDLGNISAYKYTSYSAQYHGTTMLPVVKFTYDISPMGIVVEEKYKPLYAFLTSVCAIVGGMFTVFGLFDSVVYETNRALTKKMSLGKHR